MSSFQRAERSQRKVKLGLQGPSGSGKTLGALALATQIVGPNGRIALADTEAGSASLYASQYTFDTVGITPPYLSKKYEDAIADAVSEGYDLIIIDSLSHQWAGEGGILARKEALDLRGGNHFTNWAKFTPEQEKFKATIVNAPIHIIGTLRTKQDYVLEERSGKSTPKKVGLAAIQREGMEYELDINFEIQMDHKAVASKDRTFLFANTEMLDLLDGSVGKRISEWMAGAKPIVPATEDQIIALLDLAKDDTERTSLKTRVKGISETTARQWIEKMEQRPRTKVTA